MGSALGKMGSGIAGGVKKLGAQVGGNMGATGEVDPMSGREKFGSVLGGLGRSVSQAYGSDLNLQGMQPQGPPLLSRKRKLGPPVFTPEDIESRDLY